MNYNLQLNIFVSCSLKLLHYLTIIIIVIIKLLSCFIITIILINLVYSKYWLGHILPVHLSKNRCFAYNYHSHNLLDDIFYHLNSI